jgi:hypothetical protein
VNYENPGGQNDHGNTTDHIPGQGGKREISGMFGRLGLNISMADVTDGTANTIMIGETIPMCDTSHGAGWWHYNGGSGASHASTSAPINEFTTCRPRSRRISNPNCTDPANWNYSWGFKSEHPGVCGFLFVDGTVHYIAEDVGYRTYQALGGRGDGVPVGQY